MNIFSSKGSNSLNRIVNSRWFALVDLACVSVAIILWELEPAPSWYPLIIAVLPWIPRLLVGKSPIQPTRFDLPLALLLVTAALAVWATYDREAASSKFWLLVGAVLLYYAIAGQPESNLWLVAVSLALVGIGIVIYYLLSNDWNVYSSKFDILNRAGLWWMSIRPVNISIEAVHPNEIAGVSAITLPILVAIGLRARREKQILFEMLVAFGVGIILITMILTTSIEVWIALGATAVVFVTWVLSGYLARFVPLRRGTIFGSAMILLGSLMSMIFVMFSDWIIKYADSMLGSQIAQNRFELTQGAVNLIGDFPFTGGGLDAFPGLYSRYILDTPNYIVPFSHNTYLDVTLEQGLLGLFALGWIFLGSVLLLFTREVNPSLAPLRWAVLFSLLVLSFHAFVDNIVYGSRNVPLLFLLPAMAVSLTKGDKRKISAVFDLKGKRFFLVAGLVFTGVLFSVYILRQQLIGAWYANRGAVEMARLELISWDAGQWDEGTDVSNLTPAEELFHRALRYDQRNRTAHHRLGLIAMLKRDYANAITHLEAAYEDDNNHRGIWKSLGFSYVWSGQYQQALLFLSKIPEASEELEIYPWWWRKQGREDLAFKAEAMLKRVASGVNP